MTIIKIGELVNLNSASQTHLATQKLPRYFAEITLCSVLNLC